MPRIFEISNEITRANNTTAYSSQQIINGDSLTSLIALDFSSVAAGGAELQCSSVIVLSDNGSATTKLSAVIEFFNSSTISGSTLTDGQAFNPSYAERKAKRIFSFEDISTIAAAGTGSYVIAQTECVRKLTLPSTPIIYAALIANNAYTPKATEKLTIVIRGYIL